MKITPERLLRCIGEIDDFFLEEAELTNISFIRNAKRKRIAKYSAAGLAVSFGMAAAYWIFKRKKAA